MNSVSIRALNDMHFQQNDSLAIMEFVNSFYWIMNFHQIKFILDPTINVSKWKTLK